MKKWRKTYIFNLSIFKDAEKPLIYVQNSDENGGCQ